MGSGASANKELYAVGKCNFCGDVKKVARAGPDKPLFCAHCILYGNKQAGADEKDENGQPKEHKAVMKHASSVRTCCGCGRTRKTMFFKGRPFCVACSLDAEQEDMPLTETVARGVGSHTKKAAKLSQRIPPAGMHEKSPKRRKNDSAVSKLPPLIPNTSGRSMMANGKPTRDADTVPLTRTLQRVASDVSIEILSQPIVKATLTTCSLVSGDDKDVLRDLAYQMVADRSKNRFQGVKAKIASLSGFGSSKKEFDVRSETFPQTRPRGAEVRSNSVPSKLDKQPSSPSRGPRSPSGGDPTVSMKARKSQKRSRANYALTSLAQAKYLS